jgi:hypothetical protein
MRAALAFALVMVLWSVAADAATTHRRRLQQRAIVRPPADAVPPGWYNSLGWKPIPPEENRNLDPSTRGGG